MPIKLTSGKLYFLKERDFLTGETSPYIKIGLVRNEKETLTRIKEHKTGNPREIIDHISLEVPFVEALETQMHYIYAGCWITGEWFKMDDEVLKESIKVAEGLVKEQEGFAELIEKAYALADQVSEGIKDPSKEDIALFEAYVQKRNEATIVSRKLALLEKKFRSMMGSHVGINGIVDVSIKDVAEGFDTARFKKDHPEIYLECSVEKEGYGKSFLPKGLPSAKVLCPEIEDEIKSIEFIKPSPEEMKQPALKSSDELLKMHQAFIDLQPDRVNLEWEIEKLQAQLKCTIGTHEWLGDLVQWTRGPKVIQSFSREVLLAKHPELHEKYLKDVSTSYSISIRPFREYSF